MRYSIEIEATAIREIEDAYRYIINQNAPLNADRWLVAIHKAINQLKIMPLACPQAREAAILGIDIRQSVFKSHRIIFTVKGNVTRIHRVVHSSQRTLSSLQNPQE